MDAHALLTSQGWRGSGHSLHSSSDAIGLSRPLLVAQKQNVLGLGKKQHRTSDMWWMNAFDKSLKGLDTHKEGQVVQTVTNGELDMIKKGGGKWVGKSGLYASFVKGEGLGGTLTPTPEDESANSDDSQTLKTLLEAAKPGKLRKSNERDGETKGERRARKLAKRAAKNGVIEEIEAPLQIVREIKTSMKEETKKERRQRRDLKKMVREQDIPIKLVPDENSKNKRRKEKSAS